MPKITLGDKLVTEVSRPYVIAEIGHNHMGSVDICKKLICAASKAGADAVKLQKRDNKTLFTDKLYNQPYENKNSYGKTYGLHREALEFSGAKYNELIEHAQRLRITLFATPFDRISLNFCEDFRMPFYKIQSADMPNLHFISQIAETKKPIIMSTGGATEEDIQNAVELIAATGNPLAILHCVARYPARAEDINLNIITQLKRKYPGVVIGFSSHYDGILASIGAYMMGAQIIEQHFTLSHTNKGTDHAMSLQPDGLRKLVHYLSELYKMKGGHKKTIEQLLMEREATKKLGKSMYFKRDMEPGEVLKWEDIDIKSPRNDYGLSQFLMMNNTKKFVTTHKYKAGDLVPCIDL
jgi:N-acetylneuraminate synthase/sialic acid synthase